MPEIPTMSLKTVQFNPTVFTPTQYEYKAADMSILERSLAQREARMKEAAQGKSAVDKALGELELKLNPAEAEWFEGYKQDIRNQIQSSIDSGDYGAAVRDAATLAGSVIQDPRIIGRIRSQEAYTEELKTQQARRDKGEISQNTYDWWVANNKYSYTGYVYDGTKWKAMDGNYNAKNVYFDDEFTYTVAIGTLAAPSGGSAKTVNMAAGKSVQQFMSALMAKK